MQVRELSVKQQMFLIFLGFFLIGIVGANIYIAENISGNGSLARYFLKQFQYTQINYNEILWNVCVNRLRIFLLLLMLGLMRGGKWFYGAFSAWSGFAYGYFCVLAISAFGTGGLLLCIIALFPHFICYILVFLGLVTLCVPPRRKDIWRRMGACLLLFFILSIGILLESYINPILLQKILTFF